MAQRQVVSAGLVYLAASSVSAGCWVGVRWRVAAESPLGPARIPATAHATAETIPAAAAHATRRDNLRDLIQMK
jgi:hypothetical protein